MAPPSPTETSIEKVAAALENISIQPRSPGKSHYVLPSPPEEEFPEIDAKTTRLLELVDEYLRLADEQRLQYVNGYLNLSRANYNGGSRKYGPDSFDLRPYMAIKNVDIEKDQFKIRDILEEGKISEKKTGDESEKAHETSSRLRNRREKASVRENTMEVPETRLRDPILQFGALAPYQLRQSQQFFVKGLQSLVQMLNLKKQIAAVVLEIEALEKKKVHEETSKRST